MPGAPVWVRNSAVAPTQPIGFTRVYQQGGSGRYDAAFGLRCGWSYSLFALISGVGSDGNRYAANGVSPDMPWRGR